MSAPSRVKEGFAPSPGLAVEVLRWPVDAGQRAGLLERGRPCLWLLDRGELVPELEESEAWVRLPVDAQDFQSRVQQLLARLGANPLLVPGDVKVDEDGLLTVGDQRIVVPHIEATILNRLGETPGRVVGRAELVQIIWPDDNRNDRAIDSRIRTLRTRIFQLGLTIHTIRGRGVLLAAESESTNVPASERDAPRRDPWSNS